MFITDDEQIYVKSWVVEGVIYYSKFVESIEDACEKCCCRTCMCVADICTENNRKDGRNGYFEKCTEYEYLVGTRKQNQDPFEQELINSILG